MSFSHTDASKPESLPAEDEFDYLDEDYCARCHGEGWIYESEGDASDWQEDTYCGSDDSIIACRVCGGTGVLK